jgi:hypothetical protein
MRWSRWRATLNWLKQVAGWVAELWEGDVIWERDPERGLRETSIRTLDSAKARSELGWMPTIDVQRSIGMTVEWKKAVDDGEHARTVTKSQADKHPRLQSLGNGGICGAASTPPRGSGYGRLREVRALR